MKNRHFFLFNLGCDSGSGGGGGVGWGGEGGGGFTLNGRLNLS